MIEQHLSKGDWRKWWNSKLPLHFCNV